MVFLAESSVCVCVNIYMQGLNQYSEIFGWPKLLILKSLGLLFFNGDHIILGLQQ